MGLLSTIGSASARAYGFTRSAIAAAVDEYFNRTTLLLNTSSTNGAQNNTFLDSSTNNFTITRNGNTTQGTFTPFSQTGWSVYEGTNGNYFTSGTSAALGFGTGDFTLECFAYITNFLDNQFLIDFRPPGSGGATKPVIYIGTSGTLTYFASGANQITGATIQTNTWNHIALSRVSGNTRLFLNGVQVGSTYADSNNYGTSDRFVVGTFGDAPGATNNSGGVVNGYISNLRILKGTGLYSGNYTVPTAALTAITNTSVLTFQSNRFVDSSANAIAITPSGTPSVQAFSPFAPTAAYDTAVVGGSGYFDGSGDYLTWPANLNLSNNNFTIEGWFYFTAWGSAAGGNGATLFRHTPNDRFLDLFVEQKKLKLVASGGGVTIDGFLGSTILQLNTWNHIALVRNGTTFTGYINGVAESSPVTGVSSSFSNMTSVSTGIGDNYITGYVSDLRVVNGTAVYTSGFTPPTVPLTAITNTNSLLKFTNSGIYDSTAKNVLETVGNAQVSTTQAKWGTTSLYCPATNGNYFVSPPNQRNFIFGTGNFTVEAWVYPTAFTNSAAGLIGYGLSGGYVDWNLEINTSGTVLYIDNDAGRFSSSSNLPTNTWTHIAIVRTDTAVTMYFNGTSVGSYSTINNISGNSSSARLYVGTGAQVPGSRQFIGYIDDPRISKYARYTSNFTAPTAAFGTQ